jgi:hypothetical protein
LYVDVQLSQLHLNSTFHSIDLCIYPVPVAYCLDSCSFVLSCETRKCEFFKIILAVLTPLNFHMNFRISWDFDKDCSESSVHLGKYYQSNNIKPSGSWTWDVFLFNFFQ